MNIEVYVITYNEEKILPFFLDHYSKFCNKITVFDNYSTDLTDDIINNYDKCEVSMVKYDTQNTLNDSAYLAIKNNCWKESKADYVIVVDADEFVYSDNIIDLLKNTNKSLYKCVGYDMVSEKFPIHFPITNIKTGHRSPNYDKICIFSPNLVKDMNYTLGCHYANPVDYTNSPIPHHQIDDLKLLHYKNISLEYRLNKHKMYLNRLSEFNKNTGSGIHYTFSEDDQEIEFVNLKNLATIVI